MTDEETLYNALSEAKDHIFNRRMGERKEPVYIVAKKDQKRLEKLLKVIYGEVKK